MKKTINKVVNDLEVGFKMCFDEEEVNDKFIELLDKEGIENEVDEEGYLYWTYSIVGSVGLLSKCIWDLNLEGIEVDFNYYLKYMLQIDDYIIGCD